MLLRASITIINVQMNCYNLLCHSMIYLDNLYKKLNKIECGKQ